MCTLGNCDFHCQLAVKWTSIYIIVTIPSKLRLVKKWIRFDYGKGVKFKKPFSGLFIFFFFFWLNSRISLTGVHPHMKLGRDIDFGNMQRIETSVTVVKTILVTISRHISYTLTGVCRQPKSKPLSSCHSNFLFTYVSKPSV